MPQPLICEGGLPLWQLLPEAQLVGDGLLEVRRWVRDPWQIRPGDGWVVLPSAKKRPTPGGRRDWERSLAEGIKISSNQLYPALARGAAAVLAQCPPNEDLPIPLILVPDVQDAWGRICHAQAGHPSKTLKLIAVSGRIGTTPTCWLLKEVLAQGGFRPGLISSLGSFDGTEWKDPPRDDPEEFANQLAHMLQHQCTHVVVEVSATQLVHRSIAGAELDGVCLGPFRLAGLADPPGQAGAPAPGADSSESFPHPSSQKDYSGWPNLLQTGLFRYLKPEGLSVIWTDDPFWAEWLSVLEGPVLTVGYRQMADLTAHLLETQLAEQTFLLQAGADVLPVRTRRIGKEHIISCLLATALGLAYGLDLPQVVRALEAVETVPAHLERIERGQPFAVFLQLVRSAAEIRTALRTVRRGCKGRLWCVAGLPARQEKKGRLFHQVLAARVDRLLLTVDDPSSPLVGEKIPCWVQPILEAFPAPTIGSWIPDRGEAIFTALREAQPGDCVLILTKLGKTYPPAEQHELAWDDRAVVHTCLEHLYPEQFPLGG